MIDLLCFRLSPSVLSERECSVIARKKIFLFRFAILELLQFGSSREFAGIELVASRSFPTNHSNAA